MRYLTYANKNKVEHIQKFSIPFKRYANEHKQLAEGTNATKWIEDSPFYLFIKIKDFITMNTLSRKRHGFELEEVDQEELKSLVPGLSQNISLQ